MGTNPISENSMASMPGAYPQPSPNTEVSEEEDIEAQRLEWKAKCKLQALPAELSSAILQYVHKKSDLLSVCCVGNRALLDAALPLLYTDLYITVSNSIQPKLMQMLTLGNPGLPLIRTITVSPTFYAGESASYQWIQILVNALQKNVLKSFHWDSPRELPPHFLRLLWQRQSRLQRVEILSPYVDAHAAMTGDASTLQEYFDTHQMPAVKELRIVPTTAATALAGSSALQACAPIESLLVDARMWTEGNAHHDMSTGELVDSLTSLLFDRVKPAVLGQGGTICTVTTLALSDINLRFAQQTWFRYLDVAQLTHLKLEHCEAADVFLSRLSAVGSPPALQSLVLVHEAKDRSDNTIHSVEDVLGCSKRTMRVLQLCIRNASRMPGVAFLEHQAKSLERLVLDITDVLHGQPVSLYYDSGALETLTSALNINFKQLGLHLAPSTFEYMSWKGLEIVDFAVSIDIIARQVPNIHTLAILNWPEGYNAGNHRGPAYYAGMEPQLARLAGDIFARFRKYDPRVDDFVGNGLHSNLEVVSFGVREPGWQQPPPKHFVESKVSYHGKERRSAERMRMRDLLDQDLDVDILCYEPRVWDVDTRKEVSNHQPFPGED